VGYVLLRQTSLSRAPEINSRMSEGNLFPVTILDDYLKGKSEGNLFPVTIPRRPTY